MKQENEPSLHMQPSNKNEVNRLIQSQFGVAARDYVTSAVHAQGVDLPWLVDAAHLTGTELVVDVATGTGHTALALASRAREVIGVDFTVEMLNAARQLAQERQIQNVRFVEGDAHALLLADQCVDLVVCRQAAHHFIDPVRAVSEWARVLKPQARLLFVDSVVPDDPELDAYINEVEFLRDSSHVRNRSVAGWLALFKEAGISARVQREWAIHMDVPTWTQRMRTPVDRVERILFLFSHATQEQQASLNIQRDGDIFTFDLPCALIAGTRSA